MNLMRILTSDGVEDIEVHTEQGRSLVGGYWSAVQRFLATGETSALEAYSVTLVSDRLLLTDPDRIERFAQVGELDIDDIYEELS